MFQCNICFHLLYFQLELPIDELEGKLNKSKLKLVLTNGKIQGWVLQILFFLFCLLIAKSLNSYPLIIWL